MLSIQMAEQRNFAFVFTFNFELSTFNFSHQFLSGFPFFSMCWMRSMVFF